MITDVAGVNDQSFNQSAWEGLQRAEKELGVEVRYLESNQDADYMQNIFTDTPMLTYFIYFLPIKKSFYL